MAVPSPNSILNYLRVQYIDIQIKCIFFLFLTKLTHCRYRVIKDMFILLCFGLTCTFAYQAVEEERFLEQYLLSSFVIMQVSQATIH